MKDDSKSKASCIPDDAVKTIRKKIPKDETIYDLADLFKVFGDSTRIKILSVLALREMCVNHIADILSISQSAVSHQLRTLKNAHLVKFRREGKTVYYSLDDEHVQTIFSQGLEHLAHK